MRVVDTEVYENWKAKNTDGYGMCIFRYAEKWANLMEAEINKGAKVKDVAQKLSHDADTEGITGFMYGASVGVLSHCWVYGGELKKWHNKEYDYEGDEIVNPAIITIR